MSTQTKPKAPPVPAAPPVLRIHFVVEVDEGGTIVSSPAGNPVLAEAMGKTTTTRFAVACNPSLRLGAFDRGTSEPWGVRCEHCIKTDIFQLLKRPKPGKARRPDRSVEVDNGCCG